MEKILITGASGLIGRELVSLLQDEYECWVIGRKEVNLSKVHFIQQDIGESLEVDRFPQKMDYIIHLAQAEGHNNFPQNAEEIFKVNLYGMVQLLNYGVQAGIKKFLFASSGGIYGTSNEVLNEGSTNIIWNNLNFYQSAKFCSEVLASPYNDYFNIISFRFFFVYGKGQKESMLFARLINNVESGRDIIIGSLKDITLNPIYKSDAAQSVYQALKKIERNETFNIAGNEIVTMGQIVQIISKLLNKSVNIIYQDRKQSNILADTRKMRDLLWNPQIMLEEGLQRTIDCMRGSKDN